MILLRIKTFFRSLYWHISLGMPKSSQLIINHRFEICKSCAFFDTKNNQCEHCGCFVSNKKIFLNKLAWADQSCPVGKWHSQDNNGV